MMGQPDAEPPNPAEGWEVTGQEAEAEADRPRPVGRPRRHDDEAERRLLLDAGYTALRDHGSDFTIANILTLAGVSTRSFYRQFESKDALLCAMYRQDADWVARRLTKRLADADGAQRKVETWIDEIFDFTRVPARAERAAVLGSIVVNRADGIDAEATRSRRLLVAPLQEAVAEGRLAGVFSSTDPAAHADLVAAVTLHAARLSRPSATTTVHDQQDVTSFCLRALGIGEP